MWCERGCMGVWFEGVGKEVYCEGGCMGGWC